VSEKKIKLMSSNWTIIPTTRKFNWNPFRFEKTNKKREK